MRLLLISNSGRPFLWHCLQDIHHFLGDVRRVGYITAARLDDEVARFNTAAEALVQAGITAEHFRVDADLPARLKQAEAVFVGGGNSFALLQRLRESGMLALLAERVRGGMPYIGTSAGSNIAGPNILATNDWNVVAASRFDAMNLVPWTINPHYHETDPAMAPGSETRDQRIGEYLAVNDNPVLGIEEQTAVRIENDAAYVVGSGRAKLFLRNRAPRWMKAGDSVPLAAFEAA